MGPVTTIRILGDNFVYLCEYGPGNAFVVDPSDSSPLLGIIKERGLTLTDILVTHHHWDHIAGLAELKRKTGCKLIGGDRRRIPGIDCVVDDGEILPVGSATIQVITTPGHTRTSCCYYALPSDDGKSGIVWTGDTLFTGGCGRLLECDAESMWQSLLKLACLPDNTLVYCGHDYAVENYEFALGIEPDNQTVRQRLQELKRAESQGRQTVPSTMSQERATNPFLRADTTELKTALSMAGARAVEAFAELRRRKDIF